MEELELINEAINIELQELEDELSQTKINKFELKKNINNLQNINDKIYRIFENCNGIEEDLEQLEAENQLLKLLLLEASKNDFQLLMDLKFKYNIYE